MAKAEASRSWRGLGCIGIVVLLALLVGYIVFRNASDEDNYIRGHVAYLQTDCVGAIAQFDRVLNAWPPMDFWGYGALAEKEKNECAAFQRAVEAHQHGDYGLALSHYIDFANLNFGSVLREAARNRIMFVFLEATPAQLASVDSCGKILTPFGASLIPQPGMNLPYIYFACGQVYDQSHASDTAFELYAKVLTDYPTHTLAYETENLYLSSDTKCLQVKLVESDGSFANRPDFLPRFYFNCGQAYTGKNMEQSAFDMYEKLLTYFPAHALATEAENFFLTTTEGCARITSIESDGAFVNRPDFMPRLYFHCGQADQTAGKETEAIAWYEKFLERYPGHALAADVTNALAGLFVAQAKREGTREMSAPQIDGSTRSGSLQFTINNSSPEPMRIVFNGPVSYIFELAACTSCQKYVGTGPAYCPELGPVGVYSLLPGIYDVVVQFIGASRVMPLSANWTLNSGTAYFDCFVIVDKSQSSFSQFFQSTRMFLETARQNFSISMFTLVKIRRG